MKNNKFYKFLRCLFSRKAFGFYLILTLIGYFLFEVVIFWGMKAYPYDSAPLEKKRPSTVFYDCRGNVIWAKMGEGQVWQIPVNYKEFSPEVVKAILSAEDKRFFEHNGVDYLRMIRAAVSNLTSGRIVSGASTVSMQVARMTFPEKRSWGYKFRQIFMALDMEQKFSKEWILTQYLNNAPFGSNLVGIEAASLYYFGKSASLLNLEEASLLCSLPQRPSFLRPDRFPERALKRQKWVIEQIEKNYQERFSSAKLKNYYRQVFTPAGKHGKLGHKMSEPHYVSLIKGSKESEVHTFLDPALQQLALLSLKSQVSGVKDVKDGAAVIIENRTGKLRAMVGSLNFDDREGGQVNVATSKRSPGSALKPFIYLEAIEQGKVVAETVLNDSPINGTYQPGNFDKLYRGKVTATEALSGSLNTTAVRLLREVGLETVLERLSKFGISTLKKGAGHYGLSLALGGGEVKLLELANAYAALAEKGVYRPVKVVEEDSRQRGDLQLCNPGSAELLTKMLCSRTLPGHEQSEIAWKTGTSNGLRDAWCIGYTKDYTVGVWLGNKSGRPSNSLVGFKAAVPVVSNIFKGIYNTENVLFPEFENLEDVKITEESGLRARAYHKSVKMAKKVIGIPLRFCKSKKGIASAQKEKNDQKEIELNILSPRKESYLTLDDSLKLKLEADSSLKLNWFVNGEFIKTGRIAFTHEFFPGKYDILCMTPDGKVVDRHSLVVRKGG